MIFDFRNSWVVDNLVKKGNIKSLETILRWYNEYERKFKKEAFSV